MAWFHLQMNHCRSIRFWSWNGACQFPYRNKKTWMNDIGSSYRFLWWLMLWIKSALILSPELTVLPEWLIRWCMIFERKTAILFVLYRVWEMFNSSGLRLSLGFQFLVGRQNDQLFGYIFCQDILNLFPSHQNEIYLPFHDMSDI